MILGNLCKYASPQWLSASWYIQSMRIGMDELSRGHTLPTVCLCVLLANGIKYLYGSANDVEWKYLKRLRIGE